MKRVYLLSLLLLMLFPACQKEDNELAPGQRPDERLTKVLTDYKAQLAGATYGWKTLLKPAGGGAYSFIMKFNENDRVNVYTDISSATAAGAESTYRLKAMQQPALLFDTYSPLHLLADPDPSILRDITGLEGTVGQGLYSDFEFTIDSVSENSVRLTGTLQQSKMVLVKATQAEYEAYSTGKIKTVIDETKAYLQANPFIYLPAGNSTRLQVNVDDATKTFSFIYLQNGTPQIISTNFTYTARGLLLDPPLNLGGVTIQELFWDSTNKVFYADVNGARVEVLSSPEAIIPLHFFVGVTFNAIAVPPQTEALPGSSADFASKWQQAATATLNGPYTLRLDYIYFVFNTQNQSMGVYVVVFQENRRYIALFPYNYTKTADGVYKFSAQAPNGNGQAISQEMSPLLNHFSNDNFTMDYFRDPVTGTLGQLKSSQNPDFFFTGYLVE